MSATRVATGVAERYPAESFRERALERLELEHATLSPIASVARDGDAIRVRRERVPGVDVAAASVPRRSRPSLLLQAASAAAFFAAHGCPLSAAELAAASWDGDGPAARLWIPARFADGAPTPPSAALGGFLRALFARGERVTQPAARVLLEELTATDSGLRRGELWVARVLRAFPELGAPEAAPARRRCFGIASPALRSASSRARAAAAAALAAGREPLLFARRGSVLTAGGALPLAPPPNGLAEAVRALRALVASASAPPSWIAVGPESWDAFSVRAFEAAASALRDRVEVVRVTDAPTPPSTAGEWRHALWVPCGALAASVRFYEAFAACVRTGGVAPLELLARILSATGWADFVADPTGDAPLPDVASDAPAAPTSARPPSSQPRDPGGRVESLLESGRLAAALDEAERWVRSRPERRPEAWFPLAARLCAAVGSEAPAWLDALEAERELAAGRPREARARLDRVAAAPASSREARRAARLRAAEVAAALGLHAEAARRAAAWRREHRDAPVAEVARALRLGAAGLAREGRFDCAAALLDEAEREEATARRPADERIETALVRARCLSLAGRFEDEDALYRRLRPDALAGGDELAARFLAQEARALLDRRDFDGAALRLEEALAHGGDDPSRRAELLLDLAATAYHSGDAARSRELLERCREAAAAAGREDLGRIARSNRVELLIRAAEHAEAESESASLEREARAERDDPRLLVALHHRGRIALRRGQLEEAGRLNAEARDLAGRLDDRIEIGELRLEEGDLALYGGDRDLAREAWQAAAAAPADRSERRATARERLAALDAPVAGGIPRGERDALGREIDADPYSAAERVARWQCLFGAAAVESETRERAAAVLSRGGGAALAARVFGAADRPRRGEAWRRLRDAVRGALAGGRGDASDALAALGLSSLAVRDASGAHVLELGSREDGARADPGGWRELETGAAKLSMRAWPRPAEDTASALAILLETLLFTDATPASVEDDAVESWRRLGVVTGDASMEEPYARLARFAPQSVTVLVLGESGSGKEAVARGIHALSPRSGGPFVPVNVPAIPAALLESELFGHARGAFTGADRDRRGLLEEAAAGTIFFDEIGDLALPVQAKLLRALQEREIRRVGENRSRPIDVRVVSATSRDLGREAEAGRFREDLYYRLHVAVIRLPPLRERGGDALRLARHFLVRFAREYGKGTLRLAPDAATAIASYAWPGNVRELQNAIAQAAALCDRDGSVGAALLPEPVRPRPAAARASGGYRIRLDAHRRDLIADALERADGNRTRAARDLGLSRQALLYLMKELKVDVPTGRKP
ncbi:MAG TPA: sigma 54-interacting transcriptional regulator [Thermoanaerobaculia bacterium]|jgi:DNA-binding NtrC family response regulator|nr:sigma 54-interacting transcriptional regulator [Thermoanaerobaculia bacterium]